MVRLLKTLKKGVMIIMRLFRIVGRNIRDGIRSIFRNFSLSVASISCITITLIIVALSIISSYNVENFTKMIKEDFTIIVFLDNDVNSSKREEIESKIEELDNIYSYQFESKQKIAESWMEENEIFKNIMSIFGEEGNPLKDTYLVKVEDTEFISETAKQIKNIEGVSAIKYGEGYVEQLLSIFSVVEKGLMVIVVLLIFVTAFLITNTIKLTIFSRRKEIEIMRLVGASNFNIQLPFIIEGLFLGIIGAIMPVALVVYGYSMLYLNFDGKLISPFIRLVPPDPFIYTISLILVCLGSTVGMIGSYAAVRKYLKI
jgi:cell division transport system permease protein